MTTTDTFRKEIRYDRETRDFAMYLDGELVGYMRTYHEAEVALDQLVYELLISGMHRSASELDGASAPDACAAEVAAAVARPETAMVAIDEPGLIERNIQVWPYSTAEIVKHAPADSANTWYALLVDGRHHNLVMWKHTLGRPQHMEALNRALAAVQAAIDALNPQADPPADPDPGPDPWPSIFRPVVAPGLLDEADAVLTAPATAERFSVTLRNRRACILCGGNHSAEHCPRIWLELRRPVEVFYEAAA